MKVAIIGGSGKMGRWFASFLLKNGKEVVITGRNEEKLREAQRQLGVGISSNREAVRDADVVVLSVPIDSFEEVVKDLAPFVSPNQIIIDVTSIKVAPVDIMHKYIKKGLVLGAHPVFGPGAKDIAGQNFVLTPTSDQELALANKIKQYLETRGARATLMTPRQHDEAMGFILGLAHFIAIVSADAMLSFDRFRETEFIAGTTYKVLLTLVKSVITEDPSLYACLQMNLPGMTQIHETFQKSVEDWAGIVKKKDKQEFVNRMSALRARLEKTDPDFRKAYDNMYRLLES